MVARDLMRSYPRLHKLLELQKVTPNDTNLALFIELGMLFMLIKKNSLSPRNVRIIPM